MPNRRLSTSSAHIFGTLAALALVSTGCGGDGITIEPPPPLPQAPQISDNSEAGFLVFPVTAQSTTSTASLFFVNGGQDNLVISSITIEDSSRFTLMEPVGGTATVESTDGVIVTISYAPTAKGVDLGTLVVTSNAENRAETRIDLLGPSSENPQSLDFDVVPFEASVEAEDFGFSDFPIAFARVYNVGGRAAFLARYEIINQSTPGAFRFPQGASSPGAACAVGPGNCGAGGLLCVEEPAGSGAGFCEAQPLGTGLAGFVAVPIEYAPATPGPGTATARIVVIDPLDTNEPPAEINIDIDLVAN